MYFRVFFVCFLVLFLETYHETSEVFVFSLNPHAVPKILVSDDFYEKPDAVRQFALQQQFQFNEKYHKGRRTNKQFLFPGVKERFEKLLQRRITVWDNHAHNGVFQICMAGDQLVYHSDLQSYAAVVFLTPNAPLQAGLRTVRSKLTKLRRPPTEQDAKAANVDTTTLLSLTYGNKLLDGTAWDTVDLIGNVYNRLVIWDAQLIHAAADYFGHDNETSRLFQIFFFDVEAL